MILILSQDVWEFTTELVQDWIEYLGGTCVRLNGEDVHGPGAFTIRYGNGLASEMRINIGGRLVDARDIRVVWFRRWHTYANLDRLREPDVAFIGEQVRDHLIHELRALTGAVEAQLGGAVWLSRFAERNLNKLTTLESAVRAGLRVPATLVTNAKAEVMRFREQFPRAVTKPLAQGATIRAGERRYVMYTQEVTDELLGNMPEQFFPSLVQELVDKSFEIRTFYLDGACYSMAMFSQADARTTIDFRNYNSAKPTRRVPYVLPAEVTDGICRLMDDLGLTTGSLDFVRTPAGEHVFLEVNPMGQFGMVSTPCNYGLEKKVADYLMRIHAQADGPTSVVA